MAPKSSSRLPVQISMSIAGVLLFAALSCKKNNAGGAVPQTLQQYFADAGRYSLFDHALKRTHLDTLLGGSNPYTVFAADDSAMSQAGYTAAGIDSADLQTLTNTLLYHLVPGTVTSADVQLYQETVLITADSGDHAFLEYNNYGLFYNGIALVSIDSLARNGVIQQVQTMSAGPIGDLVATIAANPALSDYNFQIQYQSNYTALSAFKAALPSAPLTLFAPSNAYYAASDADNYSNYFVLLSPAFDVPGLFFTSDLMGENVLTYQSNRYGSFSGDGLSFYTGNLPSSAGSSPYQYRIVQSNIVATNGVIQVFQLQ